jgi:hypothetical protein
MIHLLKPYKKIRKNTGSTTVFGYRLIFEVEFFAKIAMYVMRAFYRLRILQNRTIYLERQIGVKFSGS